MAEPIREIETDVLVVGGGTAGFAAALSAARSGLRVRLIEAGPKIGGVMWPPVLACPGAAAIRWVTASAASLPN
jgi:NADPH-dependent 2,4-dienoyl-CoA reductase/sulfur reductase-like enzyme